MKLSDRLKCLFSGSVIENGDSYLIEVPKREVEQGDLDVDSTFKIAVLGGESSFESPQTDSTQSPNPPQNRSNDNPPVEVGDKIDVEIESIGKQGDGVAKVPPGYVIMVPNTEVGDRIKIKIKDVQPNVAFGEVVKRYDVS